MTNAKQALLDRFELVDPFIDLVEKPSATLWGWNGNLPVFNDLITQIRPTTIIEVGSWMGQSSCTMANSLRSNRLDAVLVCVDTWLGSLEHWSTSEQRQSLDLRNGHPTIYDAFLTNVHREGLSGYVLPLPLPSTIACQLLAGVAAGMVYVDGSHDYRDVLRDLHDYWPLVRNGGALFGDDIAWPSVAKAVSEFADTIGTRPVVVGCHWVFQK